jgi:ribonuclease BN (tRNA processing enzyme)
MALSTCNGCDILLHEVYCNPAPGRGSPYYEAAHTSAAELAQIAKQAKPKLLVLYHQLSTGCSGAGLLQQVRRYEPHTVPQRGDKVHESRGGV